MRTESRQVETRLRKAHVQLTNAQSCRSLGSEDQKALEKFRDFEAYRMLIEHYTKLGITNNLGRLPALSRITVGRPQDSCVAGVWKSILIESLQWTPEFPAPSYSLPYRPSPSRAPSWSWAAMEAPIRHMHSKHYKTAESHEPKCSVIGVEYRLQRWRFR